MPLIPPQKTPMAVADARERAKQFREVNFGYDAARALEETLASLGESSAPEIVGGREFASLRRQLPSGSGRHICASGALPSQPSSS